MSKPARTPYRVQPYVDAIDIVDIDGLIVAHLANREIAIDGEPPANARFIATACNAHAALLAACKDIVSWLDSENDPHEMRDGFEVLSSHIEKCRDAIALAKQPT